jgi:pre-mRNA-processing factor SLU7
MEERRRQRELEEARKAGIVEPERDEEGKPINPHIPQFMSSAPWYLNQDQPTLKHQKNWKGSGTSTSAQEWYVRGAAAKGFQATKYRKGACTNCGSMSHKAKDCMERPRAKGAKFTNKNIAADDKVQNVHAASFDAKRDRWNGFDERDWAKNAEKFDAVQRLREEMRKKETLDRKLQGDGGTGDGDGDGDGSTDNGDGFVEDDEDAVAKGNDGKVRQLRIREDTAKYLLNLDVNSAYYDPKSRSMREDPNPEKNPSEKTFYGDNFVRAGGQEGFKSLNLYSVTAAEQGQKVHMLAMPSQAERSFKDVQERKKMLQQANSKSVLDKYGSAANAPPEDLRAIQQTEAYAEYDVTGRVLRGQDVKVLSRYEEDVMVGNHTSVWGSWYDLERGIWGYACCHNTTKHSYCSGEDGKAAALKSKALLEANMQRDALESDARRDEAEDAARSKPIPQGVWGTDALKHDLDADKLKKAIQAVQMNKYSSADTLDERKRGYNSMGGEALDVTEEQMEAWRLQRSRADDPLTNMKKKRKD